MEIEYGPFQRRIDLGADIDSERATAAYEHGMLKVHLPLAPKGATSASVPIHVERG
jgi:HSP20 family molecular chaperone IbpA